MKRVPVTRPLDHNPGCPTRRTRLPCPIGTVRVRWPILMNDDPGREGAMQRCLVGAGVALLLIPTAARAQHYGSTGITVLGVPLVGAYKYPAGVAPGYGYAAYSAPVAGYGYAAPGG